MSSIPTLNEAPDIETSSDDYARRFAGKAGRYLLDVQTATVRRVLAGAAFETVLDVGGGHGQLVPIFLERGCALTILGSDESTHRRIRESFPGAPIRLATGSVLRLPFPDRSFDVVTAVRLISHIEAWPTLVAELCRVARQSVVIDYPSWISLNALTPLLFKVKKSLEGNTRTYTSFFRSDLSSAFRANGFDVADARKQFFMPMFMHRAAKGARALRLCEIGCHGLGLTALFGSPVILRADRLTMGSPGAQR